MSTWREHLEELERIPDAREDGVKPYKHVPDAAEWLRIIALQNAELLDVLRPLMQRGAMATADELPDVVCTCSYRPYPHPKLPEHSDTPTPGPLESTGPVG